MLGLTFFYLASNQKYLERERINKKITTKFTNAKFPNIYSEELKNFILDLLKDFNERPNIEKAFLEAINIYIFRYLKCKSSGIMSIIFCFYSVKNIEQFFDSNEASIYFNNNSNNGYLCVDLFRKGLFFADENNFNYDELNNVCLSLMVLFYNKKESINIHKEIPLFLFLDFLINSLNKELNKNPELIKSSLNEGSINSTNEEDVIKSIQEKLQRYNSKITDEFSYITKTEIKCRECNDRLSFLSSIEFICLLFPDRTADYMKKKKIDIHDLFSHYTKIRSYNGKEEFCKNCNKIQNVNKYKILYNFPKTLILYIKSKYNNKFDLDINEAINIKNFVKQNNNENIEYILSGAVFIEFKENEKIYTSITKNKNEDWKYFDGKNIHNSNLDELKNHKNVKILIYSYLE